MSVLGRLLVSSSERLDLPDFLSIDSFGAGDWKFFMKSLVGDSKPYILRGFEITDPELSIGTTSVSVGVADSIVYYPGSSAGPFFHGLEEGNALSVDLVPELKKSATNFVYLTLSTTNAARDTRNFWDPDLNGGEGGEFSQDVDTESVLIAEVNVSVSSFPANTIPIAKVIMDSTSVVSIEDTRDLLFRLATGGQAGDPFNDYDFRSLPSAAYERDEPNALMNNALDPNPFQGGDKNIFTVKEWMDVVMTSIKEMKGSTYWYQGGAGSWPGSLGNLRADTAHSVITGNSLATHSAATAGLMNWSGNMHIKFLSGRLNFKILSNVATTDVTLADGQVAYLNLVRGEDIIPKLILTNGSAVVTSFAAAVWTSDLVVGDFIRLKTDQDNLYYEILSIDSGSQVTLTSNFIGTSTGLAGADAVRAFGEYQTDAAPSTNRHVQIADRLNVPLSEDVYWLFFRDDDGSAVPKIYTRFKAGEIEQGETIQIADNTSQAVIDFIGSAGEADGTPDYVTSATGTKASQTDYNSVANENLAARISRLTSMVADKAQDKTIKLASDHENTTNTTNATDQEITFSGGTPEMTVVVPSSTNNGTIGLGGTLTLAVNQAAVYTIDRNASFSLANLAALTVIDTDLVNLDENTFIFAYRLSGTDVFLWDNTPIASGTTVPSMAYLQLIIQQNKTAKLIEGGTWHWDLGTTTVSWSTDAFVQIAGLIDTSNEINVGSTALTADGQVAYVEVKRTSGASTLTVSTSDIASITNNDNIFIFARRIGNDVLVGASFLIKDGEFLELDGALAEINRYHGQLALTPNNPIDTRIKISGSDITKLSGSSLSLEQRNLLLSFDGAEIDFSTGEVFESDGTTPFLGGANDFTPFTIGSNEYFWYSVSVLPNTVNADNTISGQILVIPATASNAALSNALKAPFPSLGVGLANVYVQEDGAASILDINYNNIIQLNSKGGSGGGTGLVKVTYHDPVSSTLPTGAAVTIDGQAGVNDDLVLFSNLSSGNNKIYKLSGVGVAIAWEATLDFNLGTPEDGDTVIVQSGDSFRDSIGIFNGTDWKFNDTVRYFSGADYWEISSLKTSTVSNNTTGDIFSVTLSGSENITVEYSLFRGSTKETGIAILTSDGTGAGFANTVANIGDVGVSLSADVSGSDLRFRYTADNAGSDGTIRYFIKRWSNSPGGPGGVPSYSGSGASSVLAAGSPGNIQFHGTLGTLDADSQLDWDNTSKQLKLNGLDIDALKGGLTINDNQAASLTIISYDKTVYKYAIFEYSIERSTENRIGRLMIVNNGTVVSITDDNTDTGGAGIDDISIPFTATVSGANILIQYTSTSTGFTGSLKYSARRWQ